MMRSGGQGTGAAACVLLALGALAGAEPATVAATAVRAAPLGTSEQAGGKCDRTCLEGLVEQYLGALFAHDPARLSVTPDVRFTENGQQLELGDGLWRTVSGKGTFHLTVPDQAAGEVAWLGSIREAGTPAMLALRLGVRGRRIAEIETLVQRSDRSALGFEKIGYHWTQVIPPAERMSRDDTRIFQTPDGRTVTAGPKQPWTWELAETFQIERGKIHQIMAIMNHVEYGMNSGWSTWEQGRSDRARYLGQKY